MSKPFVVTWTVGEEAHGVTVDADDKSHAEVVFGKLFPGVADFKVAEPGEEETEETKESEFTFERTGE